MSPVLEVAAVRRLGSFTLDVAFEAPAGITALFGASGAGKTQTLRAIAGLMRPDQGRIVLAGRTLYDGGAGLDLPARQRRTGYVFQHYALFPHLDVRHNVAFGLAAWSKAERDARTDELLGLVGLQELVRRYPAELSGGQQQRVALARALAPRPDLLLLDEPFSALDALVRGQLRRELRRLQGETGVPMILVTHDLAEVRLLAQHLVLMGAGRALQAGATDAVLAEPATDEAAALLEAAGLG